MEIWRTLTVLKHHFPLNDKVTVTVELLPNEEQGEWGYTEETGHVIRISTEVPEKLRDEVLLHEYSHAITSYLPTHLADTAWGLVYGELYKVVFGDH